MAPHEESHEMQYEAMSTFCPVGTAKSHAYFCRSERRNENDAQWRLAEQQRRKSVYFDVFDRRGWPSPDELQHYFLALPDSAGPPTSTTAIAGV
jgi:hypothetical protein